MPAPVFPHGGAFSFELPQGSPGLHDGGVEALGDVGDGELLAGGGVEEAAAAFPDGVSNGESHGVIMGEGRDLQEVIADGEERIKRALLEAEQHQTQMCEAIYEADRIREQIEAATGVRLNDPLSSRPASTLDLPLAELAGFGERCLAVVEAVVLLGPYVLDAPDRSLGAVLKTVDADTATQVMAHLEASEMFPDLGEQPPE